jgi:hypothetical protein
MAREAPHGDYCPHTVECWLTDWYLLVSLAESPSTSSHHLHPGHAGKTGPCLPEPRNPGGGMSDPLRWADILADLGGAMAALPVGSLERQAAYARAKSGGTMRQIATMLRTRGVVVAEAYHAAALAMAVHLGYDPDRPCLCDA